MFSIKGFSPREYQKAIYQASKEKNTLVCLPTGTGKTKQAILLLVDRLNQFKESNIVIVSPTKPLAQQIMEEIKQCTDIPPANIQLLTGKTQPSERKKLFSIAKVIVATPQTIQFDLENKRITLENTSLLVIDECHRSRENFANTHVARIYQEQGKNQRILGLTASPGATKEKVQTICENLFIEHIELRTESDPDLAEHIQEKEQLDIKVDLTEEFKDIQKTLKNYYKSKVGMLKKYGITKPSYLINKTDLLTYQRAFQQEIRSGNMMGYRAVSTISELIKVNHALSLLETQTPISLQEYFTKMSNERSKAAKNILNSPEIQEAKEKVDHMVADGTLHPKMQKLKELLKEELEKDSELRVILFANYRSTVAQLKKEVETIQGIKAITLVGQKEGVTQKQQLSVIEKFNKGSYNVLVCTSIGEEGLSIGSLDLAIFYDHTASEIRKIQRSGRVGRIKPGKIINLIATKTLDEAMLWTAKRKETKMKSLLNYMKKDLAEK